MENQKNNQVKVFTKAISRIVFFPFVFSTRELKRSLFNTVFFRKAISFIVMLSLVVGFYFNHNVAQGENFSFFQTSWNGEQTSNVAEHNSDQTGWGEYYAKDSGINIANEGADVNLSQQTGSLSFNFNNETDYIQEDATDGTDFSDGKVSLHMTVGSGNDSNTKLLLHMEDSDLSDSSPTTKIVNKNDTVSSSTQKKFGDNSAYFNGTSNINIPYHDDWNFGTGDSTIDFWAYPTDNNSYYSGLEFFQSSLPYYTDGTNCIQFVWDDHPTLGGLKLMKYSTQLRISSSSGLNSWTHYAIVKKSGIYYLYRNGSYMGSLLSTTVDNYDGFNIGDDESHNLNYNFKGYIDEFRISDVARWANDFTPPDSAYGDGENYPISQPYYVTTSDDSQLDVSAWSHITGTIFSQTTSTDTSIKYLISFDDRSTWKYWDGDSWESSSLDNLQSNGMAKSTLEGLSQSNWEATNGFNPGTTQTIDIAADLSTSSSSVTPELDDIQFNYSLDSYPTSTQTLTSSVYNTTFAASNISNIRWTETLPSNTDIKFQIRTSSDGTNWGSWCGPDDEVEGTCSSTTYFTDPEGSETIDDTQRDRANDQYFQYKAYLSSSDGVSTPTLSDVTIFYSTTSAPTVSTGESSSITANSATLSGDISYTGEENPERSIEYGNVSGNYTNNCTVGIGGTGFFSCDIDSLNPNTTYYFRAKAQNSSGIGYGEEQSFRTRALNPAISGFEDGKLYFNDVTPITENGTATINGDPFISGTAVSDNGTYEIIVDNGDGVQVSASFSILKDKTVIDPNPTKMNEDYSLGIIDTQGDALNSAGQAVIKLNYTLKSSDSSLFIPRDTQITPSTEGNIDFSKLTTVDISQSINHINSNSKGALRMGISSENINFSRPVVVTIEIQSGYNGKTLSIYSRPGSGEEWEYENTCTVSDDKCVFSTTHATEYTANYEISNSPTPTNVKIDINATIALTCTEEVSMGAISGSNRSNLATNDAICNVKTNNSTGYSLYWQASNTSLFNQQGDDISSYTPENYNTPENWFILPTESKWGAKLHSGSTTYSSLIWGNEDTYSNGNWLNVSTSPYQIISRNTETTKEGDDEIILFGAEVGSDKVQSSGTYRVNVTMTATTM